MYRLIEVKQKKLWTSQITLGEVEAFARRTWAIKNLDHMTELGLVIAIDLADHVRESNALRDERDTLITRAVMAEQFASEFGSAARRERFRLNCL